MKKKFFVALLGVMLSGEVHAQEVVVSKGQLPYTVQKNIKKYFSKKEIRNIVKERQNGRVVYDVYFTDYTEAEFDSKGELTEVKSQNMLTTLVPAKVMSYVNRNYKGTSVVHWEKEGRKQKIELNNGLELEFDLKGNFLRVDD